ncbi:hypothetical protein O0I10_010512 [Lichtheimia ornata]|uniref:DDHD domain-containing protein n=1 Tax=Lichtheimia ornata TaxID=688661 RepID=A0AAD7UXA7_9FUNG|nr:uncharacterized protein O0I10_010512 [Lichtheimia ornata]KAJ8653831.1 hypothetical protein O0I10_010512 [Lichtheimia ornata]
MLERDVNNTRLALASPRTLGLTPDPNAPPLEPRWFYAVDSTRSKKLKWVAFSKRDSEALEKALESKDMSTTVPVNEDHLFDVKVFYRTLSPVYWEGPTYPVRRATWFMQSDGSKWVPCEEALAQQVEAGYRKYKPYSDPSLAVNGKRKEDASAAAAAASTTTLEEEKLEIALASQPVEKQWNLLGPYLGQYVAYTGPHTAWLLSNSTSSKLAKSIITRLTNKQNLGGTRLVRGYQETTDRQLRGSKSSPSLSTLRKAAEEQEGQSVHDDDAICIEAPGADDTIKVGDEDGEEPRQIDHLVFVIPGAGQRFAGQSFIDDVDNLRRGVKSAYAAAIRSDRPNGIQFLPVPWRQEIKFGISREEGLQHTEADLGMPDGDDGCPTLEELTVDSVPNIRSLVSNVIMDIPLYLTPKYREQMTTSICRLINGIYLQYIKRNPDFLERNGKVSVVGHSLGALIALDMLSLQPVTPPPDKASMLAALKQPDLLKQYQKSNALLFTAENFFGLGSPAGVMLLVKGTRVASRKSKSFRGQESSQCCYPAVNNLYNIFNRSDPVAYRLEPLISRQYSANFKPAMIPHIKELIMDKKKGKRASGSGGLTNRAGAMYESIKYGLTANLVMRGLGLSKQQMYEDMQSANSSDDDAAVFDQLTTAQQQDLSVPENIRSPTHSRSSSDSAVMISMWNNSPARQSPPPPLADNTSPYSDGARRLRLLNVTGRVDYCLQENNLDNPYWSALATHLNYWKDPDVAAFLAKEIYRDH